MARTMNSKNQHVYRAVVVTKHYSDPSKTLKSIYGPYEHKRTAGFVRSYMTGGYWDRDRIVDSWIEESDPIWTKCE